MFSHRFSRMGGMPVACKKGISPSILAYGWLGRRVQDWHRVIHFGVWGLHGGSDYLIGTSIWRMGGMVVVIF
jgi:hypothetical protein